MSSTMASKVFFLAEQPIRGRFAIADDFGGVAFGLQIEAQSLRQVGFIFDHQNPAHSLALMIKTSAVPS